MKLEKLDWDSNFFSQPVYKLEADSADDIEKAKAQVGPGSLIYVFSDQTIFEYKNDLVDKKLVFGKTLDLNKAISPPANVIRYDGINFSVQDIRHLSIVSSRQSRFRVDEKIAEHFADRLYELWAEKAINEKVNYAILGVVENDLLVGMTAIRIMPEYLKIELIAVHENYQGKGIGSSLLKGSFAFAFELKKSEVQVTTQGDNKGACALYKKHGFSVIEQKFIYHIHV